MNLFLHIGKIAQVDKRLIPNFCNYYKHRYEQQAEINRYCRVSGFKNSKDLRKALESTFKPKHYEIGKKHQENQKDATFGPVVVPNQHQEIADEGAGTVNQMASDPKADVFAILELKLSWVADCIEANHITQKTMCHCIQKPCTVLLHVVAFSVYTDFVQQRMRHQKLLRLDGVSMLLLSGQLIFIFLTFLMLKIKQRIVDDWQ